MIYSESDKLSGFTIRFGGCSRFLGLPERAAAASIPEDYLNIYTSPPVCQSTNPPSYSVTVNTLPAPRPHTSGKYIWYAVGGRVRNWPGRLARIWYVNS